MVRCNYTYIDSTRQYALKLPLHTIRETHVSPFVIYSAHAIEDKYMQEKAKIQQIPVKVYRSSDRLMIAAPMPGLQPEDIIVRVTDDNFLVLQGELRGA